MNQMLVSLSLLANMNNLLTRRKQFSISKVVRVWLVGVSPITPDFHTLASVNTVGAGVKTEGAVERGGLINI